MELDIKKAEHPSLYIKKKYLKPNKIGSNQFAALLDVNKSNMSGFLNKRIGISPKMAIKLSLVLGESPYFWLSLQRDYDLYIESKKINISKLKCTFAQIGK